MVHAYVHLPLNTVHACARLTLVCAHASNHRSVRHLALVATNKAQAKSGKRFERFELLCVGTQVAAFLPPPPPLTPSSSNNSWWLVHSGANSAWHSGV